MMQAPGRLITFCFGTAILIGMSACWLRSGLTPAADSYKRDYPSDSGYIRIALDAPAFVALGDTGHVQVTRYRCHGNECIGLNHDWPAASSSWRVEPAGGMDVTAGQIIPRSVGVVRLTTARADTLLASTVEVLPPVARFMWEPAPERVRVGDTIRASAVARDSLGRVVRVIAASSARASEETARFQILAWGGRNGTIVATGGPGVLELTARLGSRSATLRTIIDPR